MDHSLSPPPTPFAVQPGVGLVGVSIREHKTSISEARILMKQRGKGERVYPAQVQEGGEGGMRGRLHHHKHLHVLIMPMEISPTQLSDSFTIFNTTGTEGLGTVEDKML